MIPLLGGDFIHEDLNWPAADHENDADQRGCAGGSQP